MTTTRRPQHESPAEADVAVVAERSSSSEVRKPYAAPRLRCLGSVRELTLGGTKGKLELGGTLMR